LLDSRPWTVRRARGGGCTTAGPRTVAIDVDLITEPTRRQRAALTGELERQEAFAGVPLTVSYR